MDYAHKTRTPRRVVILAPGLSPQGHLDPRLDRLARVLAETDARVLIPNLDDFQQLQVTTQAMTTFVDVVRWASECATTKAMQPPEIFSASFGMLPALRAASHPELRHRIGRLFIFGGFFDWRHTLRAMLGIAPKQNVPPDPTLRPVLFINLLPQVAPRLRHPQRLIQAWRRFVQRTWRHKRYQEASARLTWAHACATEVPHAQQELFLNGCGVDPVDNNAITEALDHTESQVFCPKFYVQHVRCKTIVIHGRHDNVIPVEQAKALHAALPLHTRPECFITRSYAHSDANRWHDMLRNPRGIAAESKTLLRLCQSLAS